MVISGPIAWIIGIIIIIGCSLIIWASLTLSSYYDNLMYEELEEEQEVEDMDIQEALQLVIKELEENTSCGRLGEKLRIAKLTLKKYVEEKIIEDREKQKNQEKE